MVTRLPAALALGLFSSSAFATVDVYLNYTVPYYHEQSGDICLRRLPMLASIGIPQGSVMNGTLSPTAILAEGTGTNRYININLAATNPAMVGTYVSDSIDATGAITYAMKLDVTSLAAANGSTVTGRQATVNSAKLFLIAMADNMQKLAANKWRLHVQIIGLPKQGDLAGKTLYPNPTFWYNSNSTLLPTYRTELINVSGSCR